jgi:hypothetical protein
MLVNSRKKDQIMPMVKDKAGDDIYAATAKRDVFMFNAGEPGTNSITGLDPNKDKVIITGSHAPGVQMHAGAAIPAEGVLSYAVAYSQTDAGTFGFVGISFTSPATDLDWLVV